MITFFNVLIVWLLCFNSFLYCSVLHFVPPRVIIHIAPWQFIHVLIGIRYFIRVIMKVDPDGVLASLIKSSILLNPYSAIEDQLVKKATYVQSRIEKLQQYNDLALAGTQLTPSQDDARSKLDEVVKHQKYVKGDESDSIRYLYFDNWAMGITELLGDCNVFVLGHASYRKFGSCFRIMYHLTSIVQRDRQFFEKSVKAADILLTNKLDTFRSTTVAQTNVYGEIVSRLLHPPTTEAFLSGTKGAIVGYYELQRPIPSVIIQKYFCSQKMTKEEIDALSRLKSAFYPTFNNCSSLDELETRAADAAVIVSHIISETTHVVDKETGLSVEVRILMVYNTLTGKEVFALLNSIKNCDFFSDGCFSWESEASDSITEAVESDSPTATSTDSVAEDTNEEISFPLVSESTHSDRNNGADLTDLEDPKENFGSTDVNDSGHQTAVDVFEEQPVIAEEMTKNYEFKKTDDPNYNGDGFRPGRYPSRPVQPWDRRNRNRGYKADVSRNVLDGDEQQAAKKGVSMSSNEFETNRKSQRDRRFINRQDSLSFREGKVISRETLQFSDRKEGDKRAYYFRQNMNRSTTTKNSVPISYELRLNRRPAPTTIGFIFADRG
ncbi:hypothetical protein DICVIV_11043 [Dictyocaulus viviparus]|uniref:Uncharacterized protein n=1 Tax=Dictyocaulus viviparus TaxID=29172 RepID=A0A0D8XE92_DICVI|nr:hypothetical protein DICVIV_11043 [Dictyocaulus viviparus]